MGKKRIEPDLVTLQAAADELPVDRVVRLLADPAARYAIVLLHDEPTRTLEELADVVTGKTASVEGTIATPADRDRVRIRLYHVILPRLDTLGFAAFDADAKAVTDADIPDAVTDALGVTDSSP